MIPRVDMQIESALPAAATFWVPSAEDLESDEGFGYFRDVWLIFDVSADDAEAMVRSEANLVSAVDQLARDFVEFDQIARAVEDGDIERLPERLKNVPMKGPIQKCIEDEESPLDGLELGVAGLVYALASVGCFPAASCRSHPNNSWSDVPVVLFAARQPECEVVANLAASARCGLDIDPARPDLLSVYAASIEDLMELARSVLSNRSRFNEFAIGHS